MIQELFGGGSAPTGLLGERKISSIPFPPSSSSPTCPSTTPIHTTPTTTTTTAPLNSSNTGANPNNNSETTQNLRCPRCDSTNTKFCYYNNYNLTQPRHFCKTCRRYWTKGGTLRNVPIGGGCRKNKSSAPGGGSSATSGLQKSSSNAMAKAKATLSTELLVNGNSGFLGNGFLDPLHHHHSELQPGSSPIFWPSLPQAPNSHILALLRGTTPFPPNPNSTNNPNPNPNPNPSPLSAAFASLKTESITTSPGGLDSYGNGAPSMVGSFSRSNQNQLDGFGLGGGQDFVQNGGNNTSNILDLYQRLKSSSNYNYCANEYPGMVILGNAVSPSSSSAMNATVFEASPVSGGDHNFGGYNFMSSPATSNWFDLPTVPINGAFP